MESISQDLRYAARALRRAPTASGVSLLALALALGANASVTSAVYSLLFRPFPADEPHRLYVIYETYPEGTEQHVSYVNFMAWKNEGHVFDGMVASLPRSFDLVESGVSESIPSEIVSWDFFETLGIHPVFGRRFVEKEDGPVCLVSHRLWKQRWSSDPDFVGKTLRLGEVYATVIGVLPKGLEHWRSADIWIALESVPSLIPKAELISRGYLQFNVIGRFATGVTLKIAQDYMDGLARRIAAEDREAVNGVQLVPLREHFVAAETRRTLFLLMASVGLVLFIACANVSNLLLSLAIARQRELAVRLSLGASRVRLLRQCLFEGLILSVLGGILGLFIGLLTTALLEVAAPAPLTFFPIEVGPWVAAFQFVVASMAGVFVAVGSGVHAMQRSLTSITASIRSGTVAPVSRHAHLGGEALRTILVFAQVSIALVLLAGTGLMLKTLARLNQVRIVNQPEQLLLMSLSLPQERYAYADLERQRVYRDELLDQLTALPGVSHLNAATSIPAPNQGYRRSVWLDDGRRFLNGDPAGQSKTPGKHAVSPGHFRILGVPIVRGRDFASSDGSNSQRVAIVNEAMAQALWPGEDPLGKKLRFRPNDPWCELIGVVGNIPYGSPRNPVKPEIYIPLNQQPSTGFWVLLRTRSAARLQAKAVAERIRKVDPLVPVLEQLTMAEAIVNSVAETRYVAWQLTGLGALSLILCAAGIFGVVNHWVSRRSLEFGVRMAIGARGLDIWLLIMRKSLILTAAGLMVGLGGVLTLTRFIESQLFEVERNDPIILLGVSVFLLACTLVAVAPPALRATTADPVAALRSE